MNKNPTWYYLRHGQTKHNQRGIIRSHDAVPLDDTGIRSMKKAARHLKSKGIQRIYSSDIPRAVQAAKIVQAELKVPHHIDARLRTRNMGSLTGAKVTSVKGLLDWFSDHPDKAPNGGDSQDHFIAQLQSALTDLKHKSHHNPDHETIVIIGHGRHMNALPRLIKAGITGKIDTKGIPGIGSDNPGSLHKISFKGTKITRSKLLNGTPPATATS